MQHQEEQFRNSKSEIRKQNRQFLRISSFVRISSYWPLVSFGFRFSIFGFPTRLTFA